jgi:hypothetical protein
MVTLSQQKRRRRVYDTKDDLLTHLSVFAFTVAHRAQIQTGELILSTMHGQVIDIIRRDGAYILIDHQYRENCVPRSMKLRMTYPAVPVPLPPKYDPTVIPPESDYTALSLPMRKALDHFAWADWKPKPRHFTICALLKRGLIQAATYGDGRYRTTPYGSALYRAYGRFDEELKNG